MYTEEQIKRAKSTYAFRWLMKQNQQLGKNWRSKRMVEKTRFGHLIPKGKKMTRADYIQREQEHRDAYMGVQRTFSKMKPENKNLILHCNITGKAYYPKDASLIKQNYGNWENAQKHYICPRYAKLALKNGPAWLYTQRTPAFIELRKKLNLIMLWFNRKTTRNIKILVPLQKKLNALADEYKVLVIKPIYHKKTDGRIAGCILKGMPYIPPIYVEYMEKQIDDIDPLPVEYESYCQNVEEVYTEKELLDLFKDLNYE
jgi:hypothetical protein